MLNRILNFLFPKRRQRQEEIKNTKGELAILRKSLKQIQVDIQKTQSQLELLTSQKAAAEAEVATYNQKLPLLKQDYEAYVKASNALAGLNQKLELTQVSFDALTKRKEVAEAGTIQTEQLLASQQEEMNKKNQTIIQLQEKVAKILKDISDHEFELAELEEKTKKLLTIEGEIESRRSALQQLLSVFESKKAADLNSPWTEEQLADIRALSNVSLYDKSLLGDILWKTFYMSWLQKIRKELDADKKTGIYRIYTSDERSYIGQAVNIGERFTQHCKAALDPNQDTYLYQQMRKQGIENFTFSILELCDKADLNEREHYWIEFFKGTESGYNTKK